MKMVKSSKSQLDEEEQSDDYDEIVTHHNSSTIGELMKVDGKGINEQKPNKYRSKHSETEQRRRSKINERFQVLRDLIPQNDQKRDKASLLLEVIEYIQFLQERVRVYEGSYQGWSHEPTKLMPWKTQQEPPESYMDHSQILKNGSCENNIARNAVESDVGPASMYESLDQPSGSTTHVLLPSIQAPSNILPSADKSRLPMQLLHESAPDLPNMACPSQSQLWKGRPFLSELGIPDARVNAQEEPVIESGSINISSAYSQGLLNTLTQALQSSGVDLSQARLSVQVDVGRQPNKGPTAVFSSKEHENQHISDQAMTPSANVNHYEDTNQARKRRRTEKK